MATRTTTVCDAYGTTRGVRHYIITVEEVVDEDTTKPVAQEERDFSPKGLKRLEHFLARGLAAPGAGVKNAPATDDDPDQLAMFDEPEAVKAK